MLSKLRNLSFGVAHRKIENPSKIRVSDYQANYGPVKITTAIHRKSIATGRQRRITASVILSKQMRNAASTRYGRSKARLYLLGGLFGAGLSANTAHATPPTLNASNFQSSTNEMVTPFGFLNGISRSGYLLGNMWGLRSWLSQYGMSLNISETRNPWKCHRRNPSRRRL
jgi:hypothetical protein